MPRSSVRNGTLIAVLATALSLPVMLGGAAGAQATGYKPIVKVAGGVLVGCASKDGRWIEAQFNLENHRRSDVVKMTLWQWQQQTGFDEWAWEQVTSTGWVAPSRASGAKITASGGQLADQLMKATITSRGPGKVRTKEFTWADMARCG